MNVTDVLIVALDVDRINNHSCIYCILIAGQNIWIKKNSQESFSPGNAMYLLNFNVLILDL